MCPGDTMEMTWYYYTAVGGAGCPPGVELASWCPWLMKPKASASWPVRTRWPVPRLGRGQGTLWDSAMASICLWTPYDAGHLAPTTVDHVARPPAGAARRCSMTPFHPLGPSRAFCVCEEPPSRVMSPKWREWHKPLLCLLCSLRLSKCSSLSGSLPGEAGRDPHIPPLTLPSAGSRHPAVVQTGRSRRHSLLPPEYKTLWFSLPCLAFGMPVDERESRRSFLSKMPDFQVYGFAAESCFEWQKLNIIFSFSLQSFHDTLKSLDEWKRSEEWHYDYYHHRHVWEVTYHLANVLIRIIALINLPPSIFL